jgi:TetR/AcrR family transcriptional repressor of mexJK operon
MKSEEAVQRRSRGRPPVESVASIEKEILATALDQFVRHGYGVSMTRIVDAARISKNTMYSRFSSKEELFRAIIRNQINRVSETLPLGPGRGSYDLERGLRNYANRTLEVSLEPEFLEVNRLIYSEARRFPELGAAAADRNRLGIAQLTDFIRYRAEMDGVPCKDPEGVAEVFILALRGWYTTAMLTMAPVTPAEREAWVDRIIRLTIAARPTW